jgi:FkbH-like protein
MKLLKLVIWDLDETILKGILEEGDTELDAAALSAVRQLHASGILQSLATQNTPEAIRSTVHQFDWSKMMVQVEADLGSKAQKVERILDALKFSPADAAFVDNDPFERASISVQIAGITAWSVADLAAYLNTIEGVAITDEARRRPQMYQEQQVRTRAEQTASDYAEYLRSCKIEITIRPYVAGDLMRAQELLTRTHRMNLGILPVDEAIARLNRPREHHVVVAEMKDIYGDMGRCGIIHLTPVGEDEAVIESLAISCRTRARGLSLAMLIGLLRHPSARFRTVRCRYIANGSNLPLRMLLLGAGFAPRRGTDELTHSAEQLAKLETPDWVRIHYQLTLTEQPVRLMRTLGEVSV